MPERALADLGLQGECPFQDNVLVFYQSRQNDAAVPHFGSDPDVPHREHVSLLLDKDDLLPVDALDGLVARQTDRMSRAGDFLDHLGDRIVEVAIFTGMAFMPGVNTPLALSVVIVSLLHSNLGTQIHASFGKRYYGGAGKTELFIALVLLTPLLAFFPSLSLPFGPPGVGNGVFMVMGAIITASFLHRLSHALRLVLRDKERE